MNTKFLKIFALLVFSIVFLNGCTQGQLSKSKVFKHNTPLIKGDIRQKGKKEVQKTLEMGPQPVMGDTDKLEKRKKISSQTKRNYLLIPDEFKSLKQTVSFRFKNLDYKEAMQLMGKIGNINVLVEKPLSLSLREVKKLLH